MRIKAIAITALSAALAFGGGTAAYAATSQSWFSGSPICHTDQVGKSTHLTGNKTADGGSEVRITFKDGSSCLTTGKGATITAAHKAAGG